MVMEISVKDDKAELFLRLVQELKSSMVDKYHILSRDGEVVEDGFFDEEELLNRTNDIKDNNVTPLSRQEVFDGI